MKLKRYFVVFSAASLPAWASAADYYVDMAIGTACADYSPVSGACGSGSSGAFPDLASGLSILNPGDTLFLRAGTYGQVSISTSGAPGMPISVRGMPGENVTVTGNQVALWIINKSNVEISDVNVNNVEGFGRIEESTGIVLSNINFSDAAASGTTGSLKFVRSAQNRVVNSTFSSGSDLLLLQDDSDKNVILGNSFGTAAHSLISIRCSSQNVIRDNDFNNPAQKIMEIFDCEGVSDAPVRLDDATGNLVEKNRFSGTAPSGQSNDYNAIQHGGQNTIVRLNVFENNKGGGVNYQSYAQESIYVHGNRLYNNTFYNNTCYAVIGQSGSGSTFFDNRVVNNILFANRSCSGGNSQTSIANGGQVILQDNIIASSDPGFIDAPGGDLTLLETSSAIDGGRFVANTVGSGNGTAMQVNDASWFYDGYGIPSESGDLIQLDGSSVAIPIAAIDYTTNTITLEFDTSWTNGQGVHLAYAGSAPDSGAFERSGPVVRPNPPGNLEAN